MTQLRTAMSGPHAGSVVALWIVAGIAALLALLHLVRPTSAGRRWSRLQAAAFPMSVAWTLFVGSVVPELRAGMFELGMTLRMIGFWAMVVTAPIAVGQIVELRPPGWLQRTHVALAAGFLVLLVVSDLVFVQSDSYNPGGQFGPLAVSFLTPVAAFAGWWLLSCLARTQTRTGLVLFALGGSATALALVIAALVVDPVLADHFLVVGFLPVLAASELMALQRDWTERGFRMRSRQASA